MSRSSLRTLPSGSVQRKGGPVLDSLESGTRRRCATSAGSAMSTARRPSRSVAGKVRS
jgi:hypothetical protein